MASVVNPEFVEMKLNSNRLLLTLGGSGLRKITSFPGARSEAYTAIGDTSREFQVGCVPAPSAGKNVLYATVTFTTAASELRNVLVPCADNKACPPFPSP